MDPRYSYFSGAHDPNPASAPRQPYARSPDHSPPPAHDYPYTQAPAPPSYHSYHPSGNYHPPPSPPTNTMLPPLVHSQTYPRDLSHSATRHDVPSGFVAPSLGPTLHDLPFSTSRSSSSGQRAQWGTPLPTSRTPPLYDRPVSHRSHSHPHPSLSHSTTHLIPTPAQTAQTYHHGFGSPPSSVSVSGSGSMSAGSASGPAPPVVAAIPPASSCSPPQERFFCEKCDKSFGRQHDKKRHYESTHLQQSHTCRFCNKTFSRNDSLKRHQDNGCDKDPEFNP